MKKTLLLGLLMLCAAGCGNARRPAASHDVVFEEPVVIEGHSTGDTVAARR